MYEFGDLEDLALLMFGMMYLVLLVLLLWFVIVCGPAVIIRYAHKPVMNTVGRSRGSASGPPARRGFRHGSAPCSHCHVRHFGCVAFGGVGARSHDRRKNVRFRQSAAL